MHSHRTKLSSILAGALALFGASFANADIYQSSSNNFINVGAGVAQVFTADASVVTLDSFLFVINGNSAGVTASGILYDGVGYSTPMDSDSVFLPFVFPTNSPLTFDFSGNTLVSGNQYTVFVSVAPDFLTLRASTLDPYPDGLALSTFGGPILGGDADFQFAVIGAVPEPTSLGLLAMVGAIALRRKTR